MHTWRAEVRAQLAHAQTLRQAGHATAPQLGARAALRQLAVHEDRYAQIVAKPGGHDKRLRARGAPLAGIQVHERHNVERAHVRVHADVFGVAILPNVDAFNGYPPTGKQSSRQRALRAREREHRAVMVGIGVDVEQARGSSGRKCVGDRLDRRLSATLGHVWDG